jgi:2-polyprenyl-3-methyl-5-hydroxy-6-metoxy-1,4-benzoquinol methylase
MQREVATDWDRGWAIEPVDPAVVDEEARTPRWKAQERLVRERFGSFEGLEVIEIGAGRGINGALYAQRGARVTLLDVSELPLSQARELYAAHGLEPQLVIGDV